MPILIAPKLGAVSLSLKTVFTSALSTIPVYMGEPITSDVPMLFVMVGSDGDPESDAESNFQHSWQDMGHTRMREDGEIPCALVSQTGSDLADSVIADAFTTLQMCASALANDPTLSGIIAGIWVTAGSERTILNSNGAGVVVPFTVNYWTIL